MPPLPLAARVRLPDATFMPLPLDGDAGGVEASAAWMPNLLPGPQGWATYEDFSLLVPGHAAMAELPVWPAPTEPDAPRPPPPAPALPTPHNTAPGLAGGAEREVTLPAGASGIVHRPEATDPEGDLLTWRIAGGTEARAFLMDPGTGALSLRAPMPADMLAELLIQVTDGWGASATQRLLLRPAEPGPAMPAPVLACGDAAGEPGLPEPLAWTPRDWVF